ncbi:MAG: LD-carboxypeptidase [Caulobacter sp.]|nr:LD-carboxypeptidase [Caulobacter sp.]
MGRQVRIGVVAPSGRVDPAVPAEVQALAARLYPAGEVEIVFDPQCFLSHGHFAGDDAARVEGFLRIANDPGYDAVWFGRGGYGACRPAEAILAGLTDAARSKTYLGYSDAGFLLAGLYARGIGRAVHGPVPHEIRRAGGAAAVTRALAFLVDSDPATLEPACKPGVKTAAFNITVLSQLLGTALEPDLTDHVLMLEEVAEYMYRIDRSLFHITSNPGVRRIAGLRLGRCSDIPPNDPDFGLGEEEVARHWCGRAGIPYLGRADIGHDADNKVVPFGPM